MTVPSMNSLSEGTKALVLFITIVSTELGSNAGLYLAMVIWLEIEWAVKIEQGILEYIAKRTNDE